MLNPITIALTLLTLTILNTIITENHRSRKNKRESLKQEPSKHIQPGHLIPLTKDQKRQCILAGMKESEFNVPVDAINQKIYRSTYYTERECIDAAIEYYSVFFLGK